MDDKPEKNTNQAISRAAFKVALGGVFSLLAGFASQMVIAAYFGANDATDAFLTATVFPVYIRSVLLSGLSFVLIPAFVKESEEHNEVDAWRIVATSALVLGIVMTGLATFILLQSSVIVRLLAPGLTPERAQLTNQMMSIIAFSLVFAGFHVVSSGIQNAQNRFFWPAVSGAMLSLVNMIFVMFGTRWLGPMSLAWGYLAGEFVQMLITTTPVARRCRHGLISLQDRRMREIGRLLLPFLALALITRLTPIVERYFASGLPAGQLSYLGYTNKVSRIFQGLLATTVVTAIFPALARSYNRSGLNGLFKTFDFGMRLTLAIALPIIAIIISTALPLVSFLFERGAFTVGDSVATARVVPIIVTASILFGMSGNLLTRIFYVTKDTKTPPLVSMISVPFYILSASLLTRQAGYVGLAISTFVFSGIGVVILAGLTIYRYGIGMWKYIGRQGLIYLVLSVLVGLLARMLVAVSRDTPSFVQLLISVLPSSIVYLILLWKTDREIGNAIIGMTGIDRIFGWHRMQVLRTAKRT